MKARAITPNIWFDNQAEEAAKFYTTAFNDSSIVQTTRYGKEGQDIHGMPEGSVLTVEFRICSQSFVALNGGPHFTLNPSISFFVNAETEKEVDRLWEHLIDGGSPLMPLDSYEWSKKYGWVQDKYGVSWQVSLGKPEDTACKISPCLLFVGELFRQAEAAVTFYTSLFHDSGIDGVLKNGDGENQPGGSVKHAQFRLAGQSFMAMDSGLSHDFTFNEGISFIIHCENQKVVDYYWSKLLEGGEPLQCGWLKDRFGVTWQVVPDGLTELISDSDYKKSQRAMAAMMQMVKLDIHELQKAYDG